MKLEKLIELDRERTQNKLSVVKSFVNGELKGGYLKGIPMGPDGELFINDAEFISAFSNHAKALLVVAEAARFLIKERYLYVREKNHDDLSNALKRLEDI